jgi:hypothetical protein
MNEATLQRKVQAACRAAGAYCVKFHGGEYGSAGTPDILVCLLGKFIAIETKIAPEVPTAIQTYRMRQIYEAGGVAFTATSVEDATRVLGGVISSHQEAWELMRNFSRTEIESLEAIHKEKPHGDE